VSGKFTGTYVLPEYCSEHSWRKK